LPGNCIPAPGTDCLAATGHDNVSVVSTLSINERRAISFGNVSVACAVAGNCSGDATLTLGIDGDRTPATGGGDNFILLHGGLAGDPGGQSPGHYAVTGADEGGATEVYISFADENGNPVDFAGENYHAGAHTTLTGPAAQTFQMDDFVINETGTDVYGHYVDTGGSAGPIDVAVGATLHTVGGQSYPPGKYTGTFTIMVSY
jgi:hypothetical protein